MTNKKYSKEDIAAVFKTHFAEQSLIVMGMDKQQRSGYTETALVKIKDRNLNKTDIENWILSIPRFRDLFIYENLDHPVRVRLKTIDPPIEFVEARNWDELQILDWLETQHLSFNIQQAPLFKIFVFNANNSQYLTCCYHHLLFDAISIQYAFASLLAGTKLSEQEWLPKLNIESDVKTSEVSFHLQNFVPAALNEDNKFLYENLELPDLNYKEFMAKWAEFLFLATGEEQICIGEVFNLRNSESTAQAAIGYYVQTWPLILKSSSNINEEIDNQRSKILSIHDKPVQNFYQSGLFDHCWVLEPELKSDFKSIFRSRPHYLLSIVIQAHEKGLSLSFVWNLNKIIPEGAKEIVNSFINFLNGIGA